MNLRDFPGFALVLDAAGAVRAASPLALEVLQGNGFLEAMDDTTRDKIDRALTRAAAGSVVRGWEVNLRSGQDVRTFLLDIGTSGDGTTLVTGSEVTRYVTAVSETGASWIRAEEARERAATLLVSRASHELRTPLGHILGFAQLLAHADLDEDAHSYLEEILRGGQEMVAVTDDLMTIAALEDRRYAPSLVPVPLQAVVSEQVTRTAAAAAGQAVRVETDIDEELKVRADPTLLSGALSVLLDNALGYGGSGGTVRVEATTTMSFVRVSVRDHGPGIPAGELSMVFAPFERLAMARGDVVGTGLGLARARAFVTAMGGTMGAENEPNGGARFWFELPQAQACAVALECYADRKQLPALEGSLVSNGGIWIVHPKGQKNISQSEIINLGVEAGFIDNKSCSFSETHSAIRFVIPKFRR